AIVYLLDLAQPPGLSAEDEDLTRGALIIDDDVWISRGGSDAPSSSGAMSKGLSDTYDTESGYAVAPPLPPDMEYPSAAPEDASPPMPEPEPELAVPATPAPFNAPPPAVAPQPPQSPQPGPTTGSFSRWPQQTPPRTEQASGLERVTFTAYHPRETRPQQWQPMVVYLSLDDPAAMAQVTAYAAERLAGKLDQFRPARSSNAAGLRRGAQLRIVPSAPGFEFNPSHLDVTWREDVQQHEFRMCAVSAKPGQSVNGVVQFYQGLVLRAEVPIAIFVGQAAAHLDSPDAFQQAIARAYRRIFASYSHQDMPVVESCETAARSMGDQYLRDVSLLQSGQQWDPRLIQAINDADIFQLFWSKRAASSPFVEREWRHALMLLPVRPNFIRPVYWNRQLYPAPPELANLHFQPLSLSSLGWSKLRTAWYEMRNS
ncbi:MAG TPA: toll/interleukin-1 receptor domain-containing protein, partial [Ktedonobacterales bacterium]|nr:toll/interleukin-1 receptor domain-containing protein [Ktedonobacterales bacterium]